MNMSALKVQQCIVQNTQFPNANQLLRRQFRRFKLYKYVSWHYRIE